MNKKNKKILLISASNIEYDGRLRELIAVCELIGTVETITCGQKEIILDRKKFFKNNSKFKYFHFIRFITEHVKKHGHYDIILADNRKALIPAFLCRKYAHFLIHDSRELYVISEVRKISSKIGCIIEKCLIKKFDLIISANKERAKIMAEIYGLPKEPFSFENIREIDNTEMDESCKNIWDKIFEKYKYNLISTAGCTISRKTDILVNVVSQLDNVALYLIGSIENKDKKEIESLINKNKADNIYVIPQLKAEQLSYFLSKGQIGVVSYNENDFNNKYCASGKIYEYIYAGMPVLCTSNPPLENFCRETQTGVATENPNEGIDELISRYDDFSINVNDFKKTISIESHRKKLSEDILNEYNKKKVQI